jgi:CO/xanthine dehydrogenase FAD-binding subunit
MMNVSSYYSPQNLDDALSLMVSGEFVLIAGGTDLLPALRRCESANLMDVRNLGLDFIKFDNGYLEIGAAVTHAQLSENAKFINALPLLAKACSLVGSQQIRNRGTIGGNIVNASPCADTVPALLNCDAEINLISKGATRTIKLREFILEPYLTIKKPSELLYSVKCKLPESNTGFSYIKLGRRQAVNISRMTLAVNLLKDENDAIKTVRIAAGSVFPVTARMPEVERFLIGESPSKKLFEEAGNLAAELMIKESGVRWSTPYKMPVLTGLLTRALNEAADSGNASGKDF